MSNPTNCYGNQCQWRGKAESQQSQAQAYKLTDNWQPGDWGKNEREWEFALWNRAETKSDRKSSNLSFKWTKKLNQKNLSISQSFLKFLKA